MERRIRRIDRAISEEEAKEMLTRGEYGILSTVSKDDGFVKSRDPAYSVPRIYQRRPAIHGKCRRKNTSI
jgi:hypothetical protein